MNNIFILDGQTDEVLGHINKKYVIDNEHEKDLPSHKDYFLFTVLADNKHAEHLNKRNGLIIPGEDGELLEFRIFESIKYRNNEGLFIEVHALATYLDLKNQKIFDPHKTGAETALQHATIALDGTEWQVGEIDFKGIRTLTFDNPFNSYDYILRIAREFELEPRFYVETDGNKVTGRYVDLVERIGEFRGRTIEFGRDLQSIERKEDTSEVVTALWVYGPQREDGTRLKIFVEDNEARERWGRKGKHIVDYYEPQTDDQNITESRLRTLGEMELRKRINAVVTYEAEIIDLENVPGLENKKIRFGDTIRIKDTKFNPPLYVEARVFNVKRDVFNKAKKTVQLGDFVEYTEEEVQAIWKQLQQQIQQKISAVQAEQMIEEYAEPKKVESPTPPPIIEGVNPIWVDTSQEPYIPHVADTENNEWVRMTLSDEDVLVNGVNYNGLKWSKEEGLIVERSDGKVRSVLNGTDGIKVQQKDVNDNWVDVFFVDSQGNVKYAGHLEGASGTFGEVTAIDGDFFFQDANSQTKYGIITKTNLITDHSFELAVPTGNVTSGGYFTSWDSYTWGNIGTPRLFSGYNTDAALRMMFGFNYIGVNNSNYIRTSKSYSTLVAGETYTFSSHFMRYTGSPTPKLRVKLMETNEITGNTTTLQTWEQTFPTLTNGSKIVRHSITFTLPNDFGERGDYWQWVQFEILSGNSSWLYVDGVQLVEGDYPTVYEEESSLWMILNGLEMAKSLEVRDLYSHGSIRAGGTSGYINLRPGNEHGFIEFYRTGGRAAYIGVPSAGSEYFDINAHGLNGEIRLRGRNVLVEQRLISPQTYNVTVQNPANVFVTSNGYFARSTSSKRYKADIQYNDIDYKKILKLQQASWVDRNEFENNDMSAEGLKRYYGAIAEDFERIGLSEYVVYNEETGEVENFSDRAWVLLIPNINDILHELEQIKERLERLENEGNSV